MEPIKIIFLLWKSQKKRETERDRNLKTNSNCWKLPRSGERHGHQVYEAQRCPNRFNLKRTSPSHIIIKFSIIKYKEKFESSKREKTHHIQGILNKGIRRFLSRNPAVQERVEWYIPSTERKIMSARMLYPAKVSFRNEEIKTFSHKQKLW